MLPDDPQDGRPVKDQVGIQHFDDLIEPVQRHDRKETHDDIGGDQQGQEDETGTS